MHCEPLSYVAITDTRLFHNKLHMVSRSPKRPQILMNDSNRYHVNSKVHKFYSYARNPFINSYKVQSASLKQCKWYDGSSAIVRGTSRKEIPNYNKVQGYYSSSPSLNFFLFSTALPACPICAAIYC